MERTKWLPRHMTDHPSSGGMKIQKVQCRKCGRTVYTDKAEQPCIGILPRMAIDGGCTGTMSKIRDAVD